jgi:hypothetical protein
LMRSIAVASIYRDVDSLRKAAMEDDAVRPA